MPTIFAIIQPMLIRQTLVRLMAGTPTTILYDTPPQLSLLTGPLMLCTHIHLNHTRIQAEIAGILKPFHARHLPLVWYIDPTSQPKETI